VIIANQPSTRFSQDALHGVKRKQIRRWAASQVYGRMFVGAVVVADEVQVTARTEITEARNAT
jgi:hypothetical protein